MKKVSIVGCGRVGETTALVIAQEGLCQEIALLDVREGAAAGAALDIRQSTAYFGFDVIISGDDKPEVIRDSDLVIVTAGSPRKPGMSRSDVLDINRRIIDSVVDQVLEYAPDAMLLMVSNPVDVLTWQAWKRTGWDRSRVFGQAGVLDAARMASYISQETGCSVRDIHTLVIGGHGDTMMPMFRYSSIHGIPATTFLDEEAIRHISQRTCNGGAEILALRKTTSAYNAPAAAIATMVDAISHNRRRILPCICALEGEYRQDDITIGVPAVLGRNGIERIIELELNASEQEAFQLSLDTIRADVRRL
jgi:malate dehydrogenase